MANNGKRNKGRSPSGGPRRVKTSVEKLLPVGDSSRWQLQDAKAQFSKVVQLALEGKPQCVSRHGTDAVVVVSYDALLEAVQPKISLLAFFQNSPLADLDVEFDRIEGDYREVEL